MAKRDIDAIRFYMLFTSCVMLFIYFYFNKQFEMNWAFKAILSIMLVFNFILWFLERKITKK